MEVLAECRNCHQEVNVADNMFERPILNNKLILTILGCPHCGIESVVQIDNKTTLNLFQKQLNLSRRIGKTQYLSGQATDNQKRKQKQLSETLLMVRQDLINKYNHTLYQFEGVEHQLDFYAPSVQIGGE